jgi:glucosamine--fructose-6-phosphate aminotransferase (isomerizing)
MSAAELLHGPISIASPLLPAIVLAGDEHVQPTVGAAVSRLRAAGAPVVLLATSQNGTDGVVTITVPTASDPMLQPIVAIDAAYRFFATLARARGRDPDHPPHLQKVTRTL